ncbi:hypothetical protein LCGC14_2146690 [marine sediment metagenome]|uniref:Uncharacterized protein n=1 Tax=marine sediment metagenome TaxID=412755 RepID=A0A0F9G9N8_9ZZZZ
MKTIEKPETKAIACKNGDGSLAALVAGPLMAIVAPPPPPEATLAAAVAGVAVTGIGFGESITAPVR